MAVVDFEQDPTAPYGTGNFRDDKGRVMYLHDPDTAQSFVKTMRGAPSSPAAPDLRLAENRPPPTESFSPGAALIDRLDQSQVMSDVPAPSPGMPPEAPGAPPAAAPPSPAPAAAPAPAAPAGPAGAPPAAPGANPGATLVQNWQAADDSIAQRSQPREAPVPKPNPSGGVPLYSVHSGDQVSVEEGRPIENVIEQIGEEEPLVKQDIDLRRKTARERDQIVDAGYRAGMGGTEVAYSQAFHEGTRAIEARQAAEKELARVNQEIRRIDSSLDPDRVIKNMSTGKRVGMVILAALNGAFGALIGQKENGVITALNLEIERDIDRQKHEVANKKISLNNDFKRYLDAGLDAKQAEALARGKLEAAVAGYKELETKRTSASGENARQTELLIQPLLQAWTQRKGDLLKEGEAKVKRTRDEGITHQIPPPSPFATPQGALAQLGVDKERVEQANAKQVGDVLGHPVSPEEAAKLIQDKQEFASKVAVNTATRGNVRALAEKMGLKVTPGGISGEPDPGVRPLGATAFSDQAREVDRYWSAMKESKIMAMAREPSAKLQDHFGQAIDRPFYDSDVVPLLNQIWGMLNRADKNLRQGYGEAATLYDNTPTQPPSPAPGARPPAPAGKPGHTKPPTAAPTPGGDLRSE